MAFLPAWSPVLSRLFVVCLVKPRRKELSQRSGSSKKRSCLLFSKTCVSSSNSDTRFGSANDVPPRLGGLLFCHQSIAVVLRGNLEPAWVCEGEICPALLSKIVRARPN